MRERADDHYLHLARRPGRGAQLFAVALVAAIAAAPIASSRHELTVRHVRCVEHDELTHVPASRGDAPSVARSFSSVEGQAGETPDGHDHCAVGFLVRARAHVSVIRAVVAFTPPPTVVREVRDRVLEAGRAFVLASAPKTSPPAA